MMAQKQQQQQQGCREYRVRMCSSEPKKYHVMRFKPPHKCDLEKLHHPTLERQTVASRAEQDLPETGEGSEYGRQWREEARQRRRGYASRKKVPDDHPWVLKEKKKGGKHFVSRKEGSVNTSSSYYLLTFCEDGVFEALPVSSWYDFVPPVKYDYLNAEEAEKKFEQRHKTLNYFSVMLSRKLREEEEGGGGEGGEGVKDSKGKGARDLYLTDSESNKSYSSGEEEDDSGGTKKGKMAKKSRRRGGKKRGEGGDDEEAGEETDEGDMEGQEVDYMSRSSSESEEEFQAKKAIKEVPKDDEEVDRQEEGEIDRGFTESSSSSEDELTEAGKEIQALMKKQTGPGGEESTDEEETADQDTPKPPTAASSSSSSSTATTTSLPATKSLAPPSTSPRPATPTKSHSKGKSETSSKKEKKKASATSTPQKRPLEQLQSSEAGGATSGTPPSKKAKGVESTSTITEEEVRRYLMRKPITSKELLKKFKSKKPDIDKNLVPEMLSRIIKKMPNVEEKRIDGKFYLSLKTTVSE